MIKIINYIKEGLLMIGTAMTSAIFLFSVCAFIALFIGPVATGFIFFVSLVVFAFYYDGEQYSKNPKVSSIHIMEFANETPKYTFFILIVALVLNYYVYSTISIIIISLLLFTCWLIPVAKKELKEIRNVNCATVE